MTTTAEGGKKWAGEKDWNEACFCFCGPNITAGGISPDDGNVRHKAQQLTRNIMIEEEIDITEICYWETDVHI